MQEDQRPSSDDVKSEVKERKVQVGVHIPSQFGTSGFSSTSGTTDTCDSLITWKTNQFVGLDVDKKDHKERLPSGTPLISAPLSSSTLDSSGGIKFSALQMALKTHYGARDTVQLPLSGQRFPIKDVSLTISDKNEQDQREKAGRLAEEKKRSSQDEKEIKDTQKDQRDVFWSSRFRLEEEWHRIDKPIAVKDIFTVDSITPAKRVLVEGRAGVGKTTFSQYVAYQWVQRKLFTSQFDYLIWLPLRQCLSGDSSRHGSMEAHVAAFVYEQISVGDSTYRPQDIETILSSGENARTLLILDGFDEVAGQLSDSSQPFYVILDELLKFPNLITTTRDYQTPPSQYSFDRRLVNIGFTDAQIGAYIQSYYAPTPTMDEKESKENKYDTSSGSSTATEQAKRLEATLKQNPRFWGLAHIPLNLALMCESWSSLQPPMTTPSNDSKILSPTPTNSPIELNLTELYQNVLLCFLKRDAQKYESSSTTMTWEALSESYVLELFSLGAIAWQGMQAQQQILSPTTLDEAVRQVSADYPNIGEYELAQIFTQALSVGFMRHDSGEETTPLLKRHYYFIHLTFQEYFAAHYVLQVLQGRQGKAACEKMQNWLAQHKYDPRHAMLLSFLGGLTTQPGYDQALQIFWYALLLPPQDVIGAQHMQLMVRCLMESRFDSRIPGKMQLLAEIGQWFSATIRMRFLKEEKKAYMEWLFALLKQEPRLLQWCGWGGLPDLSEESAEPMLKALRMSFATHPQVLAIVLKAASDEDWEVRREAMAALGELGAELNAYPRALEMVLKGACDENEKVQEAAIKVLGESGTNLATHLQVLAVVLKAAGNEWGYEWTVRTALGGLGAGLVTYPEALAMVLEAANDENEKVRVAAIRALGGLGTSLAMHPQALAVVLKAAGDKKWIVRGEAIEVLGGLGPSLVTHSQVLAAMLKAAGDQDKYFRKAAIKALGGLGPSLATHSQVLAVVLKAAGDENSDVREAAIEALGGLGPSLATYSQVLAAVLKAAGDQSQYVRKAAIKALGGLGTSLATHSQVLAVVLKAAGDKKENVRQVAVEVLGRLGTNLVTHPQVLAVVLKAVCDEKLYVRRAADEVLKNLDVFLLIQHYLHAVTQQQEGEFGAQNLYLPIFRCIQHAWPTLIFDGQSLIVVSGSQSERLLLSSPEVIRPLIDAIEKAWQGYQFPSVSFQTCVSQTIRYPDVCSPTFQTADKLPLEAGQKRRARRVVHSNIRTELELLDSLDRIVLDFKVHYRDLQLHEPPLGKGTSGTVYRGTYRLETIAIKRFLLGDFSLEKRKEIRNEASVMAAIHSDYLVHLRGVCLEAPHYCVVMEYLPKGDLYHQLQEKNKLLPTSQRYRLAADMAIGLYHLHQRGLLHRDLKSLNVLLQERDGELRAKLSDFGLSTLKRSLLQGGGMVGSLPWLAPEIVIGTGEYSKASDVYSLGLVLYELATGKVPYFGVLNKPEKPSFEQIKQWIKEGERPWKYLPKDCPVELAQLICACCAEDPKDRPAVNIVAQRLEALYVTAKKSPQPTSDSPQEIKDQRPLLTPPKENKPIVSTSDVKKTPSVSIPKLESLPQDPDKKEDKKNPPSPSTKPTSYSSRLFAPASISSLQKQMLPAFQQKLQHLCKENDYTFSIKRVQDNQLVVRFTAGDTVLANEAQIKDELIALTHALQKLIHDCGVTIKPNQFKPNWKQWTLSIQAEPPLLDQIANLLHTASMPYLPDAKTGIGFFQSSQTATSNSPSPLTSDTPETTCAMQ